MSQPLDPEARFLELAAKPGMERLRRESTSTDRGWHPIPEAERLGALVELCDQVTLAPLWDKSWDTEILVCQTHYHRTGPTHWAALTEALISSLEVAK